MGWWQGKAQPFRGGQSPCQERASRPCPVYLSCPIGVSGPQVGSLLCWRTVGLALGLWKPRNEQGGLSSVDPGPAHLVCTICSASRMSLSNRQDSLLTEQSQGPLCLGHPASPQACWTWLPGWALLFHVCPRLCESAAVSGGLTCSVPSLVTLCLSHAHAALGISALEVGTDVISRAVDWVSWQGEGRTLGMLPTHWELPGSRREREFLGYLQSRGFQQICRW